MYTPIMFLLSIFLFW